MLNTYKKGNLKSYIEDVRSFGKLLGLQCTEYHMSETDVDTSEELLGVNASELN